LSGGILGRSVDSSSSAAEFFELAPIMPARYELPCCSGNFRTANVLMQQLRAPKNRPETGERNPRRGAAQPCG
jgi:hypothetical protein